MKVVVIGASGIIGKAVTTLLTDKGHEVVQVSRNTQPSMNLNDPASIEAFATPESLVELLRTAGFADITARPLTFATVYLYTARKSPKP